jgi:hypothetical protein
MTRKSCHADLPAAWLPRREAGLLWQSSRCSTSAPRKRGRCIWGWRFRSRVGLQPGVAGSDARCFWPVVSGGTRALAQVWLAESPAWRAGISSCKAGWSLHCAGFGRAMGSLGRVQPGAYQGRWRMRAIVAVPEKVISSSAGLSLVPGGAECVSSGTATGNVNPSNLDSPRCPARQLNQD